MKTFTNLEEMQPYYNENTNTYEFIENGKMIDVEFDFNLNIYRNINSGNINALNINALNINALNINANNINAEDIEARNIYANDIEAWNIKAVNIKAGDIKAGDITAGDINAGNIEFYAICFSYKTFVCNTIKGSRENAKYFCLDSDVIINKKED